MAKTNGLFSFQQEMLHREEAEWTKRCCVVSGLTRRLRYRGLNVVNKAIAAPRDRSDIAVPAGTQSLANR